MATPLHLIERRAPVPPRMMLCVVSRRPDGGVSVTHVSPRERRWGENDRQTCERVAAGLGRGLHDHEIMRIDEIPKDRSNRARWRLRAGKIVEAEE